MSSHGITQTGFNRKRLDQLLAELNTEMKTVFGENFNVSPESPDGQITGIISESNANIWELAEESYHSFNPSAATGDALSNLVQLNGITRKPASASTVSLDITGTNGTLIPQGSLVSTTDSAAEFATDSDVTIGVGGTASVTATATVTGPIEAATGTVTSIDTPITGWDTVTNPADAVVGTNEETDPELRARRNLSVALDAVSVLDSIRANVRAVVGVTQANILENDTDTGPDANGLPAHSFSIVAVGGQDADIAKAIFLKKPVGITSHGNTTVPVADLENVSHNISFTRPTQIPIYITITLDKGAEYQSDGDDVIKQAIVDYANGDLIEGRGFFLGDDVIYSRLYTPINTVPNHEVVDLFIGTAPAPVGEVNIPIADTEISTFSIANITIQDAP